MHRILRVMCLTLVLIWGFATEAAAWTQDGIYWWHTPKTSYMPGECRGHCGAGCSNTLNPCGIKGYWRIEIEEIQDMGRVSSGSEEWQPQGETTEEGVCDGYYYVSTTEQYRADIKWIYDGNFSRYCYDHDGWCWGNWFDCVIPLGASHACAWIRHQLYSYNRWVTGERIGSEEREVVGWGTGPC